MWWANCKYLQVLRLLTPGEDRDCVCIITSEDKRPVLLAMCLRPSKLLVSTVVQDLTDIPLQPRVVPSLLVTALLLRPPLSTSVPYHLHFRFAWLRKSTPSKKWSPPVHQTRHPQPRYLRATHLPPLRLQRRRSPRAKLPSPRTCLLKPPFLTGTPCALPRRARHQSCLPRSRSDIRRFRLLASPTTACARKPRQGRCHALLPRFWSEKGGRG